MSNLAEKPSLEGAEAAALCRPSNSEEERYQNVDIVEKRLLGRSVRFIVNVICLTILYWCLSGGLTFFNKWFFSTRGFHFPILVVMQTFVVHFSLMAIVRFLAGMFHDTGVLPEKQIVPMRLYLRFMIPIGACTAIEIAASNMALLKLSVSFHTMVHASKPIFIAAWSVAVGLEKMNVKLFVIVCMVAVGVMMLSLGESSVRKANPASASLNVSNSDGFNDEIVDVNVDKHYDPGFNLEGFLLILFSCFSSGARWAFVQLMLQRIDLRRSHVTIQDSGGPKESTTERKERLSPMNLVYYAAPLSATSLLPFYLGVEKVRLEDYLATDPAASGDIVGFMFVVSMWSLFLNLTEFYFVRTTSGLFLSFAAISKELLLVLISVLANGDELPFLNILGFVTCVAGIALYHNLHNADDGKVAEYEKVTVNKLDQSTTLELQKV